MNIISLRQTESLFGDQFEEALIETSNGLRFNLCIDVRSGENEEERYTRVILEPVGHDVTWIKSEGCRSMDCIFNYDKKPEGDNFITGKVEIDRYA